MENSANRSIKKVLLGLSVVIFALPLLALADRATVNWVNPSGTTYIEPNFGLGGIDLLISGSNRYVNFNTITGSSGYGIRDNGGTMEFKNSGGSWAGIGNGSGTGSGLATTSPISAGNLLEYKASGGGSVFGIATSSETCTSPLSCGAHDVLTGGGAISIQAASASQAGSMAAVDYQRLYTATTTFSAPLVYTLSTNAVTCTNASSGVTGCMSANDWGLLHTATTTFSSPLSYSASTNAVTCPTCQTSAFAWPWTMLTNFGTTTDATTTPAWFQTGVYASSTSQFDNASTTLLTVTNKIYGSTSGTFRIQGGGIALDLEPASGNTDINLGNTSLTFQSFNSSLFYFAGSSGTQGILDTSGLAGSDKNFALPNWSGTFAIATGTLEAPAFVATSTLASILPYASSTAISATTFYGALVGNADTATQVGHSLSPDGSTLTGTTFNGSATVSNWALNLSHGNGWTALQNFYNNASTSQLTATSSVWFTGITNGLVSADANGLLSASSSVGANFITGTLGNVNTNSPLGGGGALTRGGTLSLTCSTCVTTSRNVNTTFPLQGGGALSGDLTLTNAFGTTTNTGISTNKLLYTSNGGIFATVATSSAGLFTGTQTNGFVLGLSGGVPTWIATSSAGSGTVTSITGGTGLNGGTITTSGTLALKSYTATSTADTSGQVLFFTSTNATPATFGGNSAFSFSTTGATLLTATNATTTNLSASQSIYAGSNLMTGYRIITGKLATSTTWTASSSPLSAFGDTFYSNTAYKAFTITSFSASTSVGTLELQFVCGASSFYYPASTTGSFYAENLSCSANKPYYLIGGNPASAPVLIPFTAVVTGF